MIRLKNVSKFYYSKGMIASGFSKVNLEFKVGEFVVITGESGSGKSTLLNVISGLDTYEEGELYIDGKETSHYTTEEFEEYRKKYIGNIFQNFNLVNSYSVYQNVELILLINGYTRTEIKDRVTEIIQKVGLREYTNTKVSKLSGGQKQRVAIARALAKETSIIVADEPTGNLDSTSAAGIVTLLREIAKDKLVVVVTHNFDQFADSATRIIKMHDGKVVEDKVVAEGNQEIKIAESRWGNISVASKLRLGIRNTFNVIPKFLLLLVVFMFVILAVSSNYTSFQKQEEEMQKLGYNPVFSNYTEDRIVVKKADGNAFTDEDYTKISDLANVKSLVKEDILMDKMLTIGGETFGFTGYPKHMNELGDRVDLGELPKAEGEVVLSGSKDDYTLTEGGDEIIGKTFKIIGESGEELSVTVSGIKYTQDGGYGLGNIYLGEAQLDTLRKSQNQKFSEVESLINDKIYKQAMENNMYKVVPNSMVPSGKAIVSEELNGVYSDQTAVGKE
ncbi:MAG: ABC transporter ATP-binding protein, partial [Anaerovoracaceae bacterium]